MALIPFNDLSTVNDPSAWVVGEDGKTYTNAGVPLWSIVDRGNGSFEIFGDYNGQENHSYGVHDSFELAVGIAAYTLGA